MKFSINKEERRIMTKLFIIQSFACLVIALLFFLFWKSDTYRDDIVVDGWGDFQDYYDDDISGKKIDCKSLVGSQVMKSPPQYRDDISYVEVDILDFEHENDLNFEQCREEIDLIVERFCQKDLKGHVASATSLLGPEYPPRKYLHFCRGNILNSLEKSNTKFHIEVDGQSFISLDNYGKTVLTSDFDHIKYGSVYKDHLWYIRLMGANHSHDDYYLYFTDKDLWIESRKSLSKVIHNTK